MTLAEKVTKLVKASGRSATWVAKEAGFSASYLWNLMSGVTKEPSGVKLRALGKVLGLTVDDLLSDRESVVIRGNMKKVMTCVRCGFTENLILMPHSDAECVHGLLISCLNCEPYVKAATVWAEYSKGDPTNAV